MKVATQTRLRRTAAEAVGSIPGIEAVVLFGSRARGTARATSDWDIAILSHASAENEQAAKRLFGDLERVHPIMVNPESLDAHCNRGTRIESAIARQGKLLAGVWTPPRCRSEDLDVAAEDIGDNLDIATRDLRSAFLSLCDAAFKGQSYVPNVVEDSQQAAETLAKTMIAGFGLSPTAVHDLNALAAQLENAYRGRTRGAEARRRFAAAIRKLDGNTEAAHKARYHKGPVERPARTAERIASTLRLQTDWLRWYAAHNPEMREAAVAAGREIADAARLVQGMRGFDRIDPNLQARVRAWAKKAERLRTRSTERPRIPDSESSPRIAGISRPRNLLQVGSRQPRHARNARTASIRVHEARETSLRLVLPRARIRIGGAAGVRGMGAVVIRGGAARGTRLRKTALRVLGQDLVVETRAA